MTWKYWHGEIGWDLFKKLLAIRIGSTLISSGCAWLIGTLCVGFGPLGIAIGALAGGVFGGYFSKKYFESQFLTDLDLKK